MFKIVDTAINGQELKRQLEDAQAGACVVFEGWVRDNNEGKDVLRLEYEAYATVAEKEGLRVLDEARAEFGLSRAVCVHRVGELAIGDMAVWVGVSSGHRAESFDACRYIIDEVKHRLPIWKKEHYADGDSGWVNCEACAKPVVNHGTSAPNSD